MRRRKTKRKNRGTAIRAAVLTVIITLLIVIAAKAEKGLKPVASLQAKHFAELNTNRIVEKAAVEYFEENQFTYGDFAAVLYDESSHVSSVEAITYNINKVQSELTLKVNRRLADCGELTDEIPIGSLTGSYMLAGKGPRLKIRICPIGSATVQLKSDFQSAGINQTRHRISAVITTRTESSLPLYSFETEESFEVLLAESILIGNVPDLTPYAWNNFE